MLQKEISCLNSRDKSDSMKWNIQRREKQEKMFGRYSRLQKMKILLHLVMYQTDGPRNIAGRTHCGPKLQTFLYKPIYLTILLFFYFKMIVSYFILEVEVIR